MICIFEEMWLSLWIAKNNEYLMKNDGFQSSGEPGAQSALAAFELKVIFSMNPKKQKMIRYENERFQCSRDWGTARHLRI